MDTSGTGVELLREGGHLHLCLVDKRSQVLFTTPFRQLNQETTEWSQIPYGFFTYGHKEDLKLEEFRLPVSTQWGQQESTCGLLAFRFIVESRVSAMRQSQRYKLRFRSPRWSDWWDTLWAVAKRKGVGCLSFPMLWSLPQEDTPQNQKGISKVCLTTSNPPRPHRGSALAARSEFSPEAGEWKTMVPHFYHWAASVCLPSSQSKLF